jgi:TP901 family phage tail tape measure protein
MASDKVKYNDLFESDIDKKLNDLEKGLKSVLEVQKSIIKEGQKGGKTAENIEKTNAALKESTKARKGLTDVQKIQVKLNELETKEGKELLALKSKLTKNRRETKQAIEAEGNAYKTLTNNTNKAQANLKKLGAQYGINSKQAKVAQREFDKLEKELREINNAAKDGRRDVGRYGTALNGAASSLKNFGAALGITAGLTGLVRLVKSSIGIFKDFEAANSNLEAILGATNEEMVLLSEQAKELGATTAFTASQVTELQTEFAKLGFPSEDIEQMTESTLNAASAMGSSLGEQAALTGATLKAFGLDASETSRVNDVLAASTTKSALDFSKLNAAMSTIAPVANSFGFSLEGTTSLLGELSNAGFDASSAATATRNILLNLADSSSELGKSLKEPVTDLPSLVKGLKQLKGEGTDLAKALQLTDKRSVAAFSTFLEGADNISVLNEELTAAGESNGEFAASLAEIQLDNLQGDVTKLGSAWEGFILSLESGSGSFSKLLRTITQVSSQILALLSGTSKSEEEMTKAEKRVNSLAKSFVTFGKIIVTAFTAFIAYRASIKAVNLAQKAYAAGQKISAIATKLFTGGLKTANISFKALNATMKANPIGLIISGITTLITAMSLFSDSTEKAAEAQEALNAAIQDGVDKGSELAEVLKTDLQTQIDNETRLLEDQLNLRKAKGEDEEKLNQELLEGSKEILRQKIQLLRDEIFATNASNTEFLDEGKKFNAAKNRDEILQLNERKQRLQDQFGNEDSLESSAVKRQRKRLAEREQILLRRQAIVNEFGKKNLRSIEELNARINRLDTEATIQATEEQTKRNNARKKSLEDLSKQLRDSQTRRITDDFSRNITKVENRYSDLIGVIRAKIASGVVSRKIANELIVSLEREMANDILKIELNLTKKIKEETEKQLDERLKALGKSREVIKNQQEKELDDLSDFQEFKAIQRADALEKEIQEGIENNDRLSENQIKFIEAQIDTEVKVRTEALKIQKEQELRSLNQRNKEIKKAQIDALKEEAKLYKFGGDEYEEIQKKIRDIEAKNIEEFNEDERKLLEAKYLQDVEDLGEEAAKKKDELRKRELAADKEADRERLNSFIKTSQEVLRLTQENLDKRFAITNKENSDEIEDSEKRINRQQELADKGGENQVAFEEKRRKDAQLKEREDLKQQQKIKERIAFAEAYLAALEARFSEAAAQADKPNPTVTSQNAPIKALGDVLVARGLAAVLAASLDGFAEGGYTGDGGKYDEAGIVHKGEFVIDKETTNQMGLQGHNMSDFKNKMYSGQLFNHEFMTTDLSVKQSKGYDNSRVVEAVTSLEKTIKSQPIQQVDVDKLGNLIEIVYKNGNRTKTTKKNPFK